MAPGRFGTHTRRVAREGRRRSRKGGTIYPVLFRIGDFEVTSFGLLVAVAAVVGLWLFERERRLSGLPDGTVDAAMASRTRDGISLGPGPIKMRRGGVTGPGIVAVISDSLT